MNHGSFDYLEPSGKRPFIVHENGTLIKSCRRCGSTYTTTSRAQKRCEACWALAAQEKPGKIAARRKAREAAKRVLPPTD